MQPDLLPPEEDQQTRADDGLEEAYDKPAIEDFRRSNGPPPKMQQAQKAAGFVAKNKKWFIGGGAGFAILIPIVAFFFWMMLFKNVHIKNLYVTYRWAQFNRGINKALTEQLEVAKGENITPKGDADTAIPDTATPAEVVEGANEAKVRNQPLEQQVTRTENTIKSVEGPAQEVLSETGINRGVITDTPDGPDQTAEQKAKANVEKEIGKNGSEIKDPPETLKDAIEQTRDADNPEKVAAETAEGVVNGSGRFAQFVRDVQGPLVIATFYCIFRDIYVTSKDQINKVLSGGAIGVAQELNKTADCQQLGECSLNQAGAVSQKFDSGDQSFTESCGYNRAAQNPSSDCEEIKSSFTIASIYDKAPGALAPTLKIADVALDPPEFKIPATGVKIGAEAPCKTIMDTKFQAIMGIVGLAGVVATAPEGEGWAIAGQVAKRGLITAAATSGGKALIVNAILTLSGNRFKNLNPIDMGNLTDMGNLAIASGTCRQAGCVKATPEQARVLNEEYRTERIAANKKRSTISKLFDTNNSDSVIARTALNTPTNPNAIIGRVGSIFANITNPIKLSRSVGSNTLALSGSRAFAAESLNDNPYNIDTYVPAPVLYKYSSKDLNAFYKGLDATTKSTLEETYKKCNSGSVITAITSHTNSDCESESYKKYAGYIFERTTLVNWARSYNNQSNFKGSTGGSVGTTTGDTTGIKRGEDTAGRPCPAGTTDKGAAKTFAGANIQLCDIGDDTVVNQSAAKAYYDMKQAAAKDRITLYGGGFRSYEEQIRLRKAHCADWQNTPPGDCNPPTAKPGRSMHEEGLAVDFKNSKTRGTPVFAWLNAHAGQYGIKNLPREPWHWSVSGN